MKYITPTLETERLLLKRGQKSDYEKVYEYDFRKLRDINNEFEFTKLNKAAINGFDSYADNYDEVFDWIIFLKDENIAIANITADREQKDIKATELAFNMHPNYWRKGYMTEAVIKVLEFLFDYGFKNVVCGYDKGNIKSKNIIEKLGFEPYKVEENAWQKDGIPITSYSLIISKERFDSLYKNNKKIK